MYIVPISTVINILSESIRSTVYVGRSMYLCSLEGYVEGCVEGGGGDGAKSPRHVCH